MRANPPFFKRILFWASFVGIMFLLLSSIGFLWQTINTIEQYGWTYEQTIIIGDNSQIQTIRLIDNLVFGIWLFIVSMTQVIQFGYLRYLIKQSKD